MQSQSKATRSLGKATLHNITSNLLLFQVMNKLSDQLVGEPLQLFKGSVHCLLLQLVPLTSSSSPCSIGRLQLRWRRRQPSALGCGSNTAAEAKLLLSSKAWHAAADGLVTGAAPSEEAVTSLDLPHVVVQDSLLTVKVVAPHNATAGMAFPFTVQVGVHTSPLAFFSPWQPLQALLHETALAWHLRCEVVYADCSVCV